MKNIIKALILVGIIMLIVIVGLNIIEWICSDRMRYGVAITILIALAWKSIEGLM